MELILLEKVANLGNLGDLVTVKPGYGRNYLVPQGKAVPATKENVAEFEQRREELVAREQEALNAAVARRDAIADQSITIRAKASPEGRLYGSIGTREIATALTDAGYAVTKAEVIMSEGSLRRIGDYEIGLRLHADVECTITLVIAEEEAS